MKTYLKTDLAYAAGFVDGEGYIQIKRTASTGQFIDTVRVGQTNRAVLDWMANMFGGSVHVMSKAHDNTREAYVWVIPSRKAERFVRLILPYMKVKKEQADIFIRYRASIRSRKCTKVLTDKEVTDRLAMIGIMKMLNHRGVTV